MKEDLLLVQATYMPICMKPPPIGYYAVWDFKFPLEFRNPSGARRHLEILPIL